MLAGLNPAQRQAVLHTGPPLIVQAGPGTGKTRALTHRLAYLLARRRVAPEEILALTFTRQAAGEMESRIRAIAPGFSRPGAPDHQNLPRPGPPDAFGPGAEPGKWPRKSSAAS